MRAVIQRVKKSSVIIENKTTGKIGSGLLVLLGVSVKDDQTDADYLAKKIVNLRIFEDKNGKMNRSLIDKGCSMLIVSQFTLMADCRKGRRPSFINAAGPQKANELYEYFVTKVGEKGVHVQTGRFGAMMDVALINDGPVTIIMESKNI